MPKSHVSRARLIAYDICSEVRRRDAFTHNVLEARLAHEEGLAQEDRAFVTTLALGVAQTWGTLDEVIDRALNDPGDLQPDVRDALRISVYEILFLDKEPHAAVDQGVELVKSVCMPAKGLANAVLRRIVREKSAFPYGDPATDMEAFARSQAFPLWLAELLDDALGGDDARAFMAASNTPAPVFLSVNPYKARDDEVVRVLSSVGAQPEPVLMGEDAHPVPGCVRLGNARALANARVRHLFSEGAILVSDAASQEVARIAVETAYGSRCRAEGDPVNLLEIGAGRATKTILLQGASLRTKGSEMQMTCIDNQGFKMDLLRRRVADYGVPVKDARVADGTRLLDAFKPQSFDSVFLDAPCSGLGTLRRHPEIRWRASLDAVRQSAALQSRMLESAAQVVKPGGTLTYATCTITREENIGVVKGFLGTEVGSHFRVAPIAGRGAFASSLSAGGPDAHFALRMVRLD